MHEISFDDAVRTICDRDKRIDRDAYYFLRESLEATVRALRNDETPEHQHVSGPELLDGLRDHALEKFGPLAATVLQSWGLRVTGDIGRMVFQLIEIGAFGRSDDDELEDFENRYDFDEAFRAPFRPKRRRDREGSEGGAPKKGASAGAGKNRKTDSDGKAGEDSLSCDEPELL